MNTFKKNPFERKQKGAVYALCIVCLLLSWSCQNRGEPDLPKPLSDELISFNLSENGKTDPELLIGEWDAVAFAYTTDGNKISNRIAIPSQSAWTEDGKPITIPGARLTIPSTAAWIDDDGTDLWDLRVLNTIWYTCSISGNLIELICHASTCINVVTPHIECDMNVSFGNAKSYVIKGNELIIYFTRIDDKDLLSHCTIIENKNLLILKKS